MKRNLGWDGMGWVGSSCHVIKGDGHVCIHRTPDPNSSVSEVRDLDFRRPDFRMAIP
jgi:hypothetical protein